MQRQLTESSLRASSVCNMEKDNFLLVCKGEGSALHLLAMDSLSLKSQEIACLEGSRNLIVNHINDVIFVGVDDRLMTNAKGSWKTVIQSENTNNIFWHICRSGKGTLYAQEYGEPPTSIHISKNLDKWENLVTAEEIDPKARHFHSICYDEYRRMLIATLGDGNQVRIAVLYDDDEDWTPIYKGAWQVLPIVVLRDLVVFGMDSGIASGGLVLWYPAKDRFEVIKLKWKTKKNRIIQMADLKLLSNGIWVATLGSSQAIIASRDLKNWYSFYVDETVSGFNHTMAIAEGKDKVAYVTGKKMLLTTKAFLEELVNGEKPVICPHRSMLQELIGVGHVIKRRFE